MKNPYRHNMNRINQFSFFQIFQYDKYHTDRSLNCQTKNSLEFILKYFQTNSLVKLRSKRYNNNKSNLILMKNNLQLFREAIKDQLPSEEIQTREEFHDLVNHLCDIKLLHPEQIKRLINKVDNNSQIKFPITFPQFELIIMTHFGDQKSQNMLQDLKTIKQKLRQTKGVLTIWKDKGMSKKERYELESIFQRGNSKMRQFYDQLIIEKQILQNISEQQLQMIDSLNQWIQVQKITQPFKNYQEYQTHHQKLIDQTFNRLRVREVHFKQRKNTSKVVKIQTIFGLDSKNDEPVQVTLIPKKTLEFNAVNAQLLTFNAKKQLILSAHFNRFLGYNSHMDTHCFLYFSEYIDGTNLNTFLTQAKIQLEEETPIFKYWVYLLYKSFYDMYLMSSYLPKLPITLNDYQISNNGLKIILKNVQFMENRQGNQPSYYQAQLLHNLGILILAILNLEFEQWSVQTKIKKIQNKSILNCLLNAEMGHSNYRSGRVKSLISFFNLQTHPLFESKNLLMGQTIIDNYEAIKGIK